MTGLALVALVVVCMWLPHWLLLSGIAPATAALLWAANLAIRALAGVFVAVYLVLFLPATEVFSALTHWCWHAVLPLLATHMGLSGHSLGDAATTLPLVVIGVSIFWAGLGVLRVARAVQRLLKRASLGIGPSDAVILKGAEVVVAAAGLLRPQVVVSAGALTCLDDEELAAGLDHERGHIARRHRWVLVFAEVCRALGVFVPGTSAAVRELNLHLERDADRWALERRHDRYALASAILKATQGAVRPTVALAALGGPSDHLTRRVQSLVEDQRASGKQARLVRVVAVATTVMAIALATLAPSTIASGLSRSVPAASHRCPD